MKKLLKRLRVEAKDIDLYRRAFRHISVPHEHSESYENLEFLGDAIIGLAVAEYLVKNLPHAEVGHLSRIRSYVVNQKSLSTLASGLGFEEYIDIEHSTLRDKKGIENSVLADCFESFVGALFLDRGIKAARQFAMKYLRPVIKEAITSGELLDYKSALQEMLQRKYKEIPRYRKVRAVGPDHAMIFTVECIFKGDVLARGKGSSLKKAEQHAASLALKKMQKE